MDEHMMAAEIAALKNEIETLKGMVKAERAKVGRVLEWVNNVYSDDITKYELLEKLDSMEPDNGKI